MSLTINVATRPAGKAAQCQADGGMRGNLPEIFGLDHARLQAEICWVDGLLKGLSGFPLDGNISSFFREGLCGINGEVTVFGNQARDALVGYLNEIKWKLTTLMALYPKAGIRFSISYQTSWES